MDDNRHSAEETAGERPAPQKEAEDEQWAKTKAFLERFYRRKFSDPTPEESARIRHILRCWQTEYIKKHPEFLKEHPECQKEFPELLYLLEETEQGETSSPPED